MATVIVMLTTATVLVAIGWLDFWIIILVALLIVSMFGKAMISWVSGETSGG
jgi:cellulose synthase/poly-beta-1,6-N-acetylglucosamine synthase-like glycosyltransferase